MIEQEFLAILNFIAQAFLKMWPFILISIPLAVAVKISGAANMIKRVMGARPIVSILLATIIGAFSPLCSCSVIPVIFSLLIGGVPLAPVMAFWIASPSVDPEIFFLSVGTVGVNLAVWRVISTLVISLSAGFITHKLQNIGWIGKDILKTKTYDEKSKWSNAIIRAYKNVYIWFKKIIQPLFPVQTVANASEKATLKANNNLYSTSASLNHEKKATVQINSEENLTQTCSCPTRNEEQPAISRPNLNNEAQSCSCPEKKQTWKQKVIPETIKNMLFIMKFMLLALFLEAIIIRYVSMESITAFLGADNLIAIMWSTLIGIPLYTNGLAALGLLSGLLAKGMMPSAALAFMIAGPTTTIPAMSAVYGIATKRIFVLYILFSLMGALVFGYFHYLLYLF